MFRAYVDLERHLIPPRDATEPKDKKSLSLPLNLFPFPPTTVPVGLLPCIGPNCMHSTAIQNGEASTTNFPSPSGSATTAATSSLTSPPVGGTSVPSNNSNDTSMSPTSWSDPASNSTFSMNSTTMFSGTVTISPNPSFTGSDVSNTLPTSVTLLASSSQSNNIVTAFPSMTLSVTLPSSSSSGLDSTASHLPIVAATSSHQHHAGAIAGGVIGGLACLVAILGVAFVLRRRHVRKTHIAPSAEFMAVAPRPGASHSPTNSRTPYQPDSSLEDLEEQPPPFTPGRWTDPVYEKVQASAALQEQYSRYEHAGSSSANEKSEGRMLLD